MIWIVLVVLASIDAAIAHKTQRRAGLEEWQHRISFLPYAAGISLGTAWGPADSTLTPWWALGVLLACGASLTGSHWLALHLGLKPRWSAPWHLLIGIFAGVILWPGATL